MSNPEGYGSSYLYEDTQAGWQFPLPQEIENLPDVSTLNLDDDDDDFPNLGESSIKGKGKGKGKIAGQSSRTVENIPISDVLAAIHSKWINKRPNVLVQKIMRDMIMYLITQDQTSGHFTIKHIYMVNGEAKIHVQASNKNLSSSLLKVARTLFKDMDVTVCAELNNFYKFFSDGPSCKKLEPLYFHPLLNSEKETVFFILDILLVADYLALQSYNEQNVSSWLYSVYDVRRIVLKASSTYGNFFDQIKCGDSYNSLLEVVKMFFHHFNRDFQMNLSMEELYGQVCTLFPNMHLDLYNMLRHAMFDFSTYFEDDNPPVSALLSQSSPHIGYIHLFAADFESSLYL